MEKPDSEVIAWIPKILMWISGVVVVTWIFRKYAGDDRKLSVKEFREAVAIIFFLWAAVYIIVTEANRPTGTEHVFDTTWLFMVFSGLLTVLHLDHALDKAANLAEALWKIKSSATTTRVTSQVTQTAEGSTEVKKEVVKSEQTKQGSDETPS